MKKIIYKMLCLIIILSLVGCGNAVSTMNEEESDINSVSNNKIVEDSELDMDDEDLAEAISDLPVDVVEEISDETVETSTSSENTVSDQSPSPEPEPHVHQYVETVTVQPTCAVAGEKTLTCECGDVRTESIPATGSHNWVEQTTVIHHDELGHVVQEKVLVGWTESRHVYECDYCGDRENSREAINAHWDSYIPGDVVHALSSYNIYDYPPEPIYETQSKWVVDQEAYDSVEVVGYYCSVCGLTNSTNTVEQTNTVE